MTTQILNGNELIIQGGLEAGFSLYTGYPGSPLADYFNILYKRRQEFEQKGIRVVIANSEANAAAMASGAKQAGRDCLVAMKSMGLHVAADALSVGNFANPGAPFKDPETGEEVMPGVVVAVGDDPWSLSTSTAADSRYLFKHLHIPFLEPSNPQELKDWMKKALHISRRTSLYQGILLTTYLAEGGGRVEVGEPLPVDGQKKTMDPKSFDLAKNVMVPPNSLMADHRLVKERFPLVEKVLKDLKLDQIFGDENSHIGVISSGVIFETVKQVMEEGQYLDSLSLYKVGCSYPMVKDLIYPYLKQLDSLIVIEEKRGFLENELRAKIQEWGLNLKVLGKEFTQSGQETEIGFPASGGLNFEIIQERLARALTLLGKNPCRDLQFEVTTLTESLPMRLPTFCPGCPHRETLSLLKDLRSDLEKKGIQLISHGDVGCYSLSFLPPFKEMHNLSAMGQGGALGAGMDMFTDNPSVVLMGDSTFFHSGITDISNSVQSGHNITYILLDNDNTAMTGHQMTPRTGLSVEGKVRPKQDILHAVRALGVDVCVEVNPSDRYFYKNLLDEMMVKDGTKVIISNKECGLTFHGRRKSKERKLFAKDETIPLQKFYQINTDACEDCRVCVESTGCPGLTKTFDAYGSKVQIDPQICVSDSYCTKLKACPSFELVEVLEYHPTKYTNSNEIIFNEESLTLPSPVKSFDDLARGQDLRIVVTGVGGSGVTTISRVLAEASRDMNGRMDLDFKFVDQKGLAQRNGNVTGHLSIFKKGKSYGAVTPLGTADLLLSPDLLDAANQLAFLGKDGVCLADKKFQIPLSIMLDYGEEGPPLDEHRLRQSLKDTLKDRVALYAMKDLCQEVFGKAVYASAMCLGVAFQSGRLPFSLSNMKSAFEKTMRKEEFDNNWHAFTLGRKVYIEGDEDFIHTLAKANKGPKVIELIKRSLEDSFLPWQAKGFIMKAFDRNLATLEKTFPKIKRDYLARYLHDIYLYDRGTNIEDFIKEARTLTQLYEEQHWEVALRTLARTYWVKDEVFVAHLMVSPLKKFKDRKAYGHLGHRFFVSYINRPKFSFGKYKLEFDLSPKEWMVKSMRHFRFLRFVLAGWHSKEKDIAGNIRHLIMNEYHREDSERHYELLNGVENIKGYREVRYEKAARI